MIKVIHSFDNIDKRKLMELYRESNEENIAFFYPQMQDKDEALANVETDYLNYIKNEFLSSEENVYVIYESDKCYSLEYLYLCGGTEQ